MLIAVSLVFFFLEVILPWRKQQKILRKDFFLDVFYWRGGITITPTSRSRNG